MALFGNSYPKIDLNGAVVLISGAGRGIGRATAELFASKAHDTLIGSATCATSNTYYLDHHGDFSLLRPTTSAQARHAAETFSLDDYEYVTA